MGIPDSQLATWARQGAVTTSQATHESIRNALMCNGSPVQGKDVEIYLQGSYKNDTNIRGDSDVDLVVQLNSTFSIDLSRLPQDQQIAFRSYFPDATYTFANFRADVLAALQAYYGLSVITEGNKSIIVAAQSGRLVADVVPCLHHRKYVYFHNLDSQSYIDGISLDAQQDGRRIISFPKPHYANGVTKNGDTNDYYKQTVRIFKNARSYLVDNNRVQSDFAPSYFLECLIYNVPDDRFGNGLSNTFCNVVNWLFSANLEGFVCQDGQNELFGTSSEQWSTQKAREFIDAMIYLWNNWR